MKAKFWEIFKKYKLALLIAFSIIVVSVIGLILFFSFSNSSSIKKYSNATYSLKYDVNWKIKSRSESKMILEHGSGSKVIIDIVPLEDKYKYSSVFDVLDELIYSIENQNKSYKLLAKEQAYVTSNKYDGYKLLYENGSQQAMVVIGKKGDKVLIVTYEASNDYFDILLDSVNSIIYNFSIKEKTFDLNYKMSLGLSKIDWPKNEKITNDLKNTKDYELANNNYLINYSIPGKFKLSSFDSNYQYFDYAGFKDNKNAIKLNTFIRDDNIYEYLDKDSSTGTVYSNYKYIAENKTDYKGFKQELAKYDSLYDSYVYKNSYTSISTSSNDNYETVELIFAINKNHIFVVKIEGKNTSISKELIDKIKINSTKNYSSYTDRKIVGDYQLSELKEFTSYDKDKVQIITLKLPLKYKELDHKHNIYEERYYGLNYNNETESYEYNIEYQVYYSADSAIKLINSDIESNKTYGEYKDLIYKGDKTINDKLFQYYEGGYSELVGENKHYVTERVLIYKLENGKCLSIVVNENGGEWAEELLNELTSFNIEINNY